MLESILASIYLQGSIAVYRGVTAPPAGKAWLLDITRTANPYGVLQLGSTIYANKRWMVDLDLRHASSMATGQDKGINSAEFSVRFYPFAR